MEPVHQRFVGRDDELEAHRVAALVRVVLQREAPVRRPEGPFRHVPRHAEDLVRLEGRRGVGPLDCGRVDFPMIESLEICLSIEFEWKLPAKPETWISARSVRCAIEG